MSLKKVAVIIINYRTSQLIQRLVDSIKETSVEMSIFIVDNASTAETYSLLQRVEDNRLHILRSPKNLGFTGGINFALNHILQNFPDIKYFFLLNPDAISCTNLISDLMGAMSLKQGVAAVSPRILYPNGESWYSGGFINHVKGSVVNSTQSKIESGIQYYEVEVFSGCAVLFDLDKVVEAGMFSEDLFMYFDEVELSIRLKEYGYSILYSPGHEIYHDVSYTTRNMSHLKSYYMTRNKFMVFNKSMNLSNKIYFILYQLVFHIKNRRIKNAYYHLQGFYDFLRGRKGAHASS